MKDRQYRAVADRVQKFIRMPGGCQWPGLRFAVPHHHTCDQIGIVECRAECMRQAVSQFAAFVDGTWHLRRAMASKLAGKGKSAEEFQHAGFVWTLLRINF